MTSAVVAENFTSIAISGGYAKPTTPVNTTMYNAPATVGISDTGIFLGNENELMCMDERFPLCASQRSLSIQYNGTSVTTNTLRQASTLVGASTDTCFSIVANPTNGAKKAIKAHINRADNSSSGTLPSAALRMEFSQGPLFLNPNDSIWIYWAQLIPAAASLATLLAGDKVLVGQIHDNSLGSGWGPSWGWKYEGAATSALRKRSLQLGYSATDPGVSYSTIDIYSQTDTANWNLGAWDIFVSQLTLVGSTLTPGGGVTPLTRAWINGSQVIEDTTHYNCFGLNGVTGSSRYQSHYPKIGKYWYNQDAGTTSIDTYFVGGRVLKPSKVTTEPEIRAWLQAKL